MDFKPPVRSHTSRTSPQQHSIATIICFHVHPLFQPIKNISANRIRPIVIATFIIHPNKKGRGTPNRNNRHIHKMTIIMNRNSPFIFVLRYLAKTIINNMIMTHIIILLIIDAPHSLS